MIVTTLIDFQGKNCWHRFLHFENPSVHRVRPENNAISSSTSLTASQSVKDLRCHLVSLSILRIITPYITRDSLRILYFSVYLLPNGDEEWLSQYLNLDLQTNKRNYTIHKHTNNVHMKAKIITNDVISHHLMNIY